MKQLFSSPLIFQELVLLLMATAAAATEDADHLAGGSHISCHKYELLTMNSTVSSMSAATANHAVGDFAGNDEEELMTTNLTTSAASSARRPAMVPALLVFGDSIVDPGNNNGLTTIIKANFPPYGKDFPGHYASGRFCNGRIPSDLIASALGIKDLVPPYLGSSSTPAELLTGVSFASSGSGYDPLTPIIVSVISMSGQLEMFREYKKKLTAIAGDRRSANILAGSVYLVCAGTDDLANTYFSTPFRSAHYDIPSYVQLLVSNAAKFIQELCIEGAQKIAFVGLPPIGCVPSQRTLAGGIVRDCDAARNEAALLFNSEMEKEIQRLTNGHLKGRLIVLLDIYKTLLDLIQRPSEFGFEVSNKGCCGTGDLEVAVLCNRLTSWTCEDDTKYVFWDSYHPTERAYQILVDQLYTKYIRYLE